MEEAFNRHFKEYGAPPEDWGDLWNERESFLCWNHGAGIFLDEVHKQTFLRRTFEDVSKAGFNVQFYANLTREQVVHALNRSRVSLSLSSRDQWPRCLTESLACGTPVVCVENLMSGRQLVDSRTGVISRPEVHALYAAIQKASNLDRDEVRATYVAEWGLKNATRKLIDAVEAQSDVPWSDIVAIQRPAETSVKRAVREIADS